MSKILITNTLIFDGTSARLFPGEVLIEGNLIRAVSRAGQPLERDGAEVLDAEGATLTPGLVESHAHLAFGSTVDAVVRKFGEAMSAEERTLRMVHAARVLLDFGFTSAYSAGCFDPRAEVNLRDAIALGWIAGPRLRACSFENNAASPRAGRYAGITTRTPDLARIREFMNDMADIGCDAVKFVITGESGVIPGTSRTLQFYEEELQLAGELARERGVHLSGHTHSAEAVKMALRAGFRVLYHCTWADEEAIDLLEQHRDSVFVSPAPGINWANCYEGEAFGITREVATTQEQFVTLERVSELMPKLRRRGVRILPGGDYGFPWNPIGRNGRDLELFVKLFGFTAAEALHAATALGGELMELPLGQIREGYLADLLLIDGNPLADIRLFQDRRRLLMIMQDGRLHKPMLPRAQRLKTLAA